MDRDYIVVGSRDFINRDDRGAVYVFKRNQVNNNWVQIKKLTASDTSDNDYFSRSLSISGDYIVVGANGEDDRGNDSGAAYLFAKNQGGNDNWGQIKKLSASDGAAGDYFGYSVSISGDYIIVGADEDNDNGNDSGSAYIFYKNQGGNDNWGEIKKIISPDGAAGDYFGYSVSISGDYIVVGARKNETNGNHSGSAYIFYRNQPDADYWGVAKKLSASDGSDYIYFGESVSINKDCIAVGAYYDDDNGLYSGSAYIFSLNP